MEHKIADGSEVVSLSERIDLKRRRRDLTWGDVAGIVGVSEETIRRWRRNEGWWLMHLGQAVRLAKALDMDVRLLLPKDDQS